MISFLKKRKQGKLVKEHLNAARHARNMREDIVPPALLDAMDQAERSVRDMAAAGEGNLEQALEALSAAVDKVYPHSNRSGIRENVEVVIVALAAAMAIRAFFVQPFKIPTGSMQPTLNGITTEVQQDAGFSDHQPVKFFKWLVTGASYKEIRATESGSVVPFRHENGQLSLFSLAGGDNVAINIAGTLQKMPSYMARHVDQSKGYYHKGEVIARAKVIAGDHILVNKMKYNFMNPDRGEISVFDTRHLEGVRQDSFYIKRLVGLPGEKIQIRDDHFLLADGVVVEDPPVFKMINESPDYAGHTFYARLTSNEDYIQLADDEYMMMGDNTRNSKDGRFFGGVPREDFQGPAMVVYWPFREHWGLVH